MDVWWLLSDRLLIGSPPNSLLIPLVDEADIPGLSRNTAAEAYPTVSHIGQPTDSQSPLLSVIVGKERGKIVYSQFVV